MKTMKSVTRSKTLSKSSQQLVEATVDAQVEEEDSSSDFSDFSEESPSITARAFTYTPFNLSDLNKKEYSLDDLRKDSDDLNEDSQSSHGKRIVEEQQLELPVQQDFFKALQTVPELHDISLDSDLEKEEDGLIKADKKSVLPERHGQFVDPVSGAILDTPELTPTPEVIVEKEKEEIKSESESEKIPQEPLTQDIILPELPKEKKIDIKALEEQDIEHFFDIPAVLPVVPEVNVDELLKLEIQRQVEEDTKKLLYSIIDHVVTKCEHTDIRTVLNASLDKEELMELLRSKFTDYNLELSVNRFLVTKCTMHFNQKGMKRFLTSKPESNRKLRKKYIEKLHLLDEMMECKQKIEEKFGSKIKNLRSSIIEKEESLARQVKEFEELVLETFTKNKSDEFRHYVEDHLAAMRAMVAEIKTVRIQLIRRQHEDVVLKKRMHEMNDLGNGVTIDKIELLGAEIQTLDKKLEAITSDINKKQEEFDSILHLKAHLAEKTELQKIQIDLLTQQLNIEIEKRENLKNETQEITKERLAIQKEMNELVDAAGGLINKPLLLEDYDNTSRKLAEIRQKNKETREEIARSDEYFAYLERVCRKKPK
ncbi:coiled-coil domain-containing protein 146-like [Teleopsis dalmanni]|uniref:coiled-coil domain-containing protein 146-like n=1 Tax=Teleopsis dalmanni TaxID=139649 RepID=UPI0018CD1B6A|nr:coiled-coil domain-containing protein 146-like [Teleopsis dalmanni]